jgi:cytochrome c5
MKTDRKNFFLFFSLPLATASVFGVASVVAGPAFAAPKTIKLPNETASYKPGTGVDIANAYCMTCHSADYVKYQPPGTTRATWTAEIKKMQHTFGAPIPDDQIAPLAEYLAKNYGNEQNK